MSIPHCKLLLDVDDTILKEVQIRTYRDHPNTQMLRYIPSTEFRERYEQRLITPSLDANKVQHYEFDMASGSASNRSEDRVAYADRASGSASDRNKFRVAYLNSLVVIRPSISELLRRIDPYIQKKQIQPYLFSANDDNRTECVLTQLKFDGKTLSDYGFKVISRNNFLLNPGVNLKKSLISLRKNLDWPIEYPIIVVDDCVIDYDMNGNDYVLQIYPFGRNAVTDYLNHGDKFDDSFYLHLILDAIEQRLKLLGSIQNISIDNQFLDKYLEWNLEKHGQIRITRYFMYQEIFRTLEKINLNKIEGSGLVFGGFTTLTKLFPLIKWKITDLEQGYDITNTSNINQKYDIIIADQVLEHVLCPWRVPENLKACLKPGGYILIAVPFLCPIHHYPIDCFRFTKTGLESLFGSYFETVFMGSYGNRYLLDRRLDENKLMSYDLFLKDDKLRVNNERYPINIWYCGFA